MNPEIDELDLNQRLSLIENMIAEGRRRTGTWGWSFVLWGVAYYVAIAWATWGHSALAWPVTMIAASLLTAILASRVAGKQPETTIGRGLMAIWLGMGLSTFAIMMALGLSGRLELHVAVAIVGGMLGAANAASSILLKWKMQFACAIIWLAAAVVSAFGTETQASIEFLVAIFVCQIAFGVYAMISESRHDKRSAIAQGASHA